MEKRIKCVCGKLLKRGAKRFCCKKCWLESPEMVKTWNTMSVSRNKLVYRTMKHTEGE